MISSCKAFRTLAVESMLLSWCAFVLGKPNKQNLYIYLYFLLCHLCCKTVCIDDTGLVINDTYNIYDMTWTANIFDIKNVGVATPTLQEWIEADA